MAGVAFENCGSLYLVRPEDDESVQPLEDFIDEFVGEHTRSGGLLVVEPRYASDLAGGLLSEGFEVSLDGRPLALREA